MAMFEHEIRTHQGACPTHGPVTGGKRVPRIKFPFFVTGVARAVAVLRPFRCPSCGSKVA
jgi:hypothetical protein